MATRLFCDGCEEELHERDQPSRRSSTELVISGSRANGKGGASPLPNGDFFWCLMCSSIAFTAVQDAKLTRAGWSKG